MAYRDKFYEKILIAAVTGSGSVYNREHYNVSDFISEAVSAALNDFDNYYGIDD